MLAAFSKAMVRRHNEQFGRGPTKARCYFAGADALVCVPTDVLLPAERNLVGMGQQERVRDSRTSFQAATAPEFIKAVEQLVGANNNMVSRTSTSNRPKEMAPAGRRVKPMTRRRVRPTTIRIAVTKGLKITTTAE